MRLEIELDGKAHSVEITGGGKEIRCAIDGKKLNADAVELSPGIYSILAGGKSLEGRVEPVGGHLRINVSGFEFRAAVRDRRQWSRKRGAALEAEGRQQVVAPMPGKVVRLLVGAGERVEARQGLFVVEAMKMQNEIRSPKSGTVERLLVKEGQAVNAGEALAVIA
jgi:biotin carboxyl carrier protein